jgi:Fe-S cluster biosynthesis and repair protein YggX
MSDQSERKVVCKKLGEELPGLASQPFPGDVGKTIYENISQRAWDMWNQDMQIKVLNEYRLNMGNPKDYEVLVQQMLTFLNLGNEVAFDVENEDRGKNE